MDFSHVYPREIVEAALRKKSSALIFAHNHPAGDSTPSRYDKQLTRDLVFVGMVLQLRVLDHIITSHNTYFSFADTGLIEEYELNYLQLKLKSTAKQSSTTL